ncbi:MAG: TM2 domain-containing protein, partial [Methylocella sp.]
MQALDLFRFSKHLRTSGQFTAEQADALTEALAFGITPVDTHELSGESDVEDWKPPPPEHDKTTAALLAIFLGGVGAHKFYLGK